MLNSLPSLALATCLAFCVQGLFAADAPSNTLPENWLDAANQGNYDEAALLSQQDEKNSALKTLLAAAKTQALAQDPQWRTFLHYKPARGGRWLSQIDAPYFFLSAHGKSSPEAELDATLAAFFSTTPKPPLRLTAHCRFVARRYWLAEKLGNLATLLPQNACPEYDRFVEYLDADSLTLIFPTAHPNSPSSAFGHTLLRIDKKDQRPESRLLNMSINFAAEVPVDVSSAAYAVFGLTGGFPGKFRMLPYHMKLREYGQIENRNTWEYPLTLDRASVDRVLRHSYEMLISEFDYYFFSENCSYHLLSLLEVADPSTPLTDEFGPWTIPVDTIRLLREKGLAEAGQFVPSSISNLRARRATMSEEDTALALTALSQELNNIEAPLSSLPVERQANILDLLSDYERYERLKLDPSAQGSNEREKAILSRRSKLGIPSTKIQVPAPETAPDAGHDTARLSLRYQHSDSVSDSIELAIRPAYHDFRDPSKAYGSKAAIQMGDIVIAQDLDANKAFLRRVTLLQIESIEPRGDFFKPISWHTNVKWQRPSYGARHEFTFSAGGGVAFQKSNRSPVFFAFGESDWVDTPAFDQRQQLRLGASAGVHWEPTQGFRFGLETKYLHQLGGDYYKGTAELWAGFALGDQWSFNIDASQFETQGLPSTIQSAIELRAYF